MKKVIRAQYYLPYKNEDEMIKRCELLNNETSDSDIYYEFYEADYGDEHVWCLSINTSKDTYGECEDEIKWLLCLVRGIFGTKPKLIISAKLEHI